MLAHDVVGSGSRRILFLHGILGSRNNWRSFARRLVEQRPQWSSVLADLRNHGDSHGLPPPHDMAACVMDVGRLSGMVGPFDVVVGHSFGGKVALSFALGRHAPVREVWVLDAPPGVRSFDRNGREEIARVLDAVRSVVLPVESRRALVEQLRARGLAEAIAQWMTTNLKPVEGGFAWRFDLDAVDSMLASFGALDLWPALDAHTGEPAVVMVRGGRSDRWSTADRVQLVRALAHGTLTEHVLEGAGHWLHTDDPDGLLGFLLPALDRIDRVRGHD